MKAKYLLLYEKIKREIASGAFAEGRKLPSKRTLAADEGVSVITVENAYALLEEEGYIEARERRGYFAVGGNNFNHSETVVIRHEKPFAVGEYFPFSVYAKTVRKVLSDYGERTLSKSSPFGCEELRRAIASYLARSRNIFVDYTQVFIGSGSEYLYGLIAQFFGQGKVFGVEDPSYEKISLVYGANGVKCEKLKHSADGRGSEELSDSAADVLHITSYKSYPSGVTASRAKKKGYAEWAEKKGAYIVEDDFSSEFHPSAMPVETVFSLSDRVIYLNTFSKTVAPSLRVGYMAMPKDLAEEFSKKLGFYSCTVPLLDQLVLAELLNGGDFERHLNRIRRKIRRERQM